MLLSILPVAELAKLKLLGYYMSPKVIRKVHLLVNVTPIEKLLLFSLACFLDDKTGKCDPSLRTLAEHTQLCETTIKKAFRRLDKLGYTARTPMYEDGTKLKRKSSNVILIFASDGFIERESFKQASANPAKKIPTKSTVEAYESCYLAKYGYLPSWNVKTELSDLLRFVQKFSHESKAVAVVKHYFTLSKYEYHTTGDLIRDARKIEASEVASRTKRKAGLKLV